MNRQLRVLIILLLVLFAAGIYAWWAAPRQQRAERAPDEGRRALAPAPLDASGEQPRLHFELLEREGDAFPGARRNIFAFRDAPSPPPKPPEPVRRPEPVPELKPEPEPVAPPPPPPIDPQRELVRQLAHFTYLGFLEKGGQKSIFLSSAGEIYVVKKGDRFGAQDEFLATGVSAKELTIRQGDAPEPIVIPLVEQKALAPSVQPTPGPWQQRLPGENRNTQQNPHEVSQ